MTFLPRILGVAFVALTAATAAAGDKHDRLYDARSMRGHFAFAMDGSFSSAPPPFSGAKENFPFTQVGRYHFDGNGGVTGEFTLSFQNPTSGGIVSMATEVGTYHVSDDGRMVIEFDDFRGGVLINRVTLDCVIAKRNRLAYCALIQLLSFQQEPSPVPLPATGLATFERQR